MASKNEAKIRFSAETQDLEQAIKNANTEMSVLRAEMKLAEAQFQNTGDSATYLQDKQELLEQALETNREKQEALTAKLEIAKEVYGEDSTEVQNLERQLTYCQVEEQNLLTQVNNLNDGLGDQAEAAEEAGSATDDMAEILANAGIVDKLKDIGEAALELAEAFDSANAAIVEGTGATGEALDALNDSAQKAFGQLANADASLSSTAEVLAELNTRFGLTGEAAEDMTVDIMNFAQHTGTDGVRAVDSIADVVKRWGLDVEDVDGLLDDLTTANQSCQMSVDELTGYLSSNSIQFQELGYSTDEALAMLISLSDGGANVGTVMGSMTKAVANLSDATDDVPGAFADAIDAMADCDSVTEALQAEVGDTGKTVEEIFGKKAAQELAANVQQGNLALEEWTAVLEDNSTALEDTTANATTMEDSWSQAVNNVSMALGGTFAPAISNVVETIAPVITQVAQVVQQSPILQAGIVAVATALGVLAAALAISSIITMVTKAFSILNLTFMANPIFLVVTALAALAAGLVYAYQNCEEFREIVNNVFSVVRSVVVTVINVVRNTIVTAWQKIQSVTTTVFNAVKNVITNQIQTARNTVNTAVSAIRNFLSFSGVASRVTSIFNSIKNAITNPIQTAKNTLSNLVSGIKGLFSNLHIELPHIKVPHFNISGGVAPWGIGGMGTKPSISIDWYRTGKILKRTTPFGTDANTGNLMVGGEAGYEAIAPIDVLQGYVQEAVDSAIPSTITDYDKLADKFAVACAKMNIGINLNGREVARAVRGMA